MMNRNYMLRTAAGLLCALVLFAGCDSVSNEKVAPNLLPSDAFAMQADLFANSGAGKAAAGTHFAAAALTVWPVSAVIQASLVIPALVTAAAVHAGEPRLKDGAFQWTSTTQAEGHPVSFTLGANPTSDYIDWSMQVQYTDPETQQEEDFVLFTARTNPNTKSGSWSLFYPMDGVRTNVLDAEYEITDEDTKQIVFSVPSDLEHGGDSVTYSRDGTTRTFVWDQVSTGETHTISWDATTHAGWIQATGYNGGEKACWDAQLNDVDCTL